MAAGAGPAVGAGHWEPWCFCSSLGRGALWVIPGGNSRPWDAPAEQLHCAALKACTVVLVPPNLLQQYRDVARRGQGGAEDPTAVYGGLWPSPGLGSRLSRWLFSICTRFIRGSEFPVSGPQRCCMPQIPLGWCGAASPPMPSPSCLCHPLSHPKCHQSGWPRGHRAVLCLRGSPHLGAGQAAATSAPRGSRSPGTEPRLAGEEGDAEGWASLEPVFWISNTGPSRPQAWLGALEISLGP